MAIDNGTQEVVAYTPQKPVGRRWDLMGMLPQKNRDEDTTGELALLGAVLQEVTDLQLARTDRFPELVDYDLTPDEFLDALLAQFGNPFTTSVLADLTPIDKRRLVAILVPIYQQKGTDPGIINAVRFFTGVEVSVRCWHRDECWLLDDARFELGGGYVGTTYFAGSAIMGPDTKDLSWIVGFEVVSPIALTDVQRQQVLALIDYMKPEYTYFLGLVEP